MSRNLKMLIIKAPFLITPKQTKFGINLEFQARVWMARRLTHLDESTG